MDATTIALVKELGWQVALAVGILIFVSKQVWPWLVTRLDKNADFQQEITREGMATQKSLASSYQQMATAFAQLTDWMRRNETMLGDIHSRVVAAADNEETTD